jgi:uncharacterized membrane protein YphA (DoxX/SURF4 family)
MATLTARWNQLWFATTSRYHYGLFRILFVGGFFVLPALINVVWPGHHQISRVARLAALEGASEELAQPVLLLRLLPLPVTPPWWLGPLIIVLAVLATIGLATRVALVGLAAGYLYAGSILNSYGFIAHDTTLPMLVLLVLAFSPGIDDLSLDAYWRSRAGPRSSERRWTGFGRRVPVWPAHLILVLLALVYFASGYAKVRESGIDWGDGETLQSYATDPQPAPYFLQDPEADRSTFRDGVGLESFLYSSGRPSWVLRAVAENDVVAGFMSTASLLWELTFPLVIVWRRLLPWYLGTGLVFHGAVTLGFGLYSFYSYPLCYLVFVDWTWVADHARMLAARVGFRPSQGSESSPA